MPTHKQRTAAARSRSHSIAQNPSRLYRPAASPIVRDSGHRAVLSQRSRRSQRDLKLPFIPPEDWHEPLEGAKRTAAGNYRIMVRPPGEGFRHVLTPQQIRDRLAELPAELLQNLQFVQLSQMTRKKQGFPCYGMQWGSSIYLYPIEATLEETYRQPPKPNQVTEARMFGGRWERDGEDTWKLIWTEEAIQDFYLHNILIHELGHLVDFRNRRPVDRERFAEWFAIQYGYRPRVQGRWLATHENRRRHHASRPAT